MGQAAGDKPQQLQDHYRFDSASSYYNFPSGFRSAPSATSGLSLATEFMPPAPITTGAVPVLSAAHASRARAWPAEAPEGSGLGAPLSGGKAEMPVVCREAARTAWPAIAGSAGMAGKTSPERHPRSGSMQEQPALHGMRLSYKLGDAGPQQLAGSSLRGGVQNMLGGEATSPGLQAAVRSGCVHLVVDALTFKVRPWAYVSLSRLPLLQVAGERTSLTCSALRLLIFPWRCAGQAHGLHGGHQGRCRRSGVQQRAVESWEDSAADSLMCCHAVQWSPLLCVA